MTMRARSTLVAVLLMFVLTASALRPAAAQPMEPRFRTALLDLYYTRWMLTHTSAVRANEFKYHQALGETYQAIRSLNGLVNVPSYRYAVPQMVPPGGPRLHAALSYLQDADRNLGPPTSVPRWEGYRGASLSHTRAAIGNLTNVIDACRC